APFASASVVRRPSSNRICHSFQRPPLSLVTMMRPTSTKLAPRSLPRAPSSSAVDSSRERARFTTSPARPRRAPARKRADVDVGGAEGAGELVVPRKGRPRSTAVEVQRREAMLGVGVDREMRLREQIDAGDAAGVGKRAPKALADDAQL